MIPQFLLPAILLSLVLIVVLFLLGRRLRSRRRGDRGEREIARLLRDCMLPGDKLINDLYLGDQRGSAQIDHVLISVRGLFVVETKNLSGRIIGEEAQPEWTQVLAGGKTVHKLYNPVMQNGAHAAALKKFLRDDLPIENIVVFAQGNTKEIRSSHVYTPESLRARLNALEDRRLLSKSRLDKCYDALYEAKRHPAVTRREHLKNVKRRKKQRGKNK